MRLTGDTYTDIRALFCAYLKILEQGGGGGGTGGPADLEFQSTATALQWRNVGDVTWETLVTFAELKTDTGFLTAISSSDVIAALTFTPVNPDGTTAQYIRGDGSKATFPTIPTNATYVDKSTAQTGIAGAKSWTGLNTFGAGLTVSAGSVTFSAVPVLATAAAIFPVLDSGVIKSRTPAQVASDINVPVTEVKTASGTGALTTINIAHGLAYTPVIVSVHPNNAASNVQPLVTSDATNFILNYAVAPATGTNNLSYNISYRR